METKELGKKFTKAEKSWIMYDWANSIYATNIMAAIFPIYYASVANDVGNKWWGIGVSIASLICALLAPILGAVADFKGYKKKILAVFVGVGVVFTAIMAFVGSWQWLLIGYVISHIGFSGSCVIYDSFITDVTTHDRMDRVSAWGYAMGYLGGSTIPFVISIAVLLLLGFDNPIAIKFSILITSVWWAVFSIPILLNVNQKHYVETPPSQLAKNAGRNLMDTMKKCVTDKGLLIYLIAYFLYIDGVGTIITVSTNYGATLGLGAVGMILALLVTQIVAVPCSIGFSKLAGKFGSIKMIISAIVVYFCICCVGFFMGRLVEPYQLEYSALARSSASQHAVETQDKHDRKMWESVVTDLVDEGKDALAEEDRPGAISRVYTDVLAQVENPDSVVYSFRSQENRRAAAESVKLMLADLSAYAADETAKTGYQQAMKTASILFWVLAGLVGTVQGGIQALSRSYFGKLVPKKRSAEFFGFYDIFGKFAAVLGPLLYAGFYMLTDRPSIGILSLLILFAGGVALLTAGRKQLADTEARMLAANAKEDEAEEQ